MSNVLYPVSIAFLIITIVLINIVKESDTTEVIIHAEQGIECVIDEYDEIWCSLTEDKL